MSVGADFWRCCSIEGKCVGQ